MVWIETPSNPLLKLIDLEAIAKIAREHKIVSVCDNTFATPWIQRPIEAGFDLVVHSATKYLNGHSDMVGGVVVVGENKDLGDQIAFLQNSVGGIAGTVRKLSRHAQFKNACPAHGAPLFKRDRNCALAGGATASEIGQLPRPEIASQHDLARQQMRGFGGMVTIVLKTGLGGTKRFLENTHLFSLAESLGGVESLINHPALMTHASVPKEQRVALGVTDSLVRLSVGVEDVRDLMDDLESALDMI
jgi:cystathionine beta-lyase/cystathionine gamma-synthase